MEEQGFILKLKKIQKYYHKINWTKKKILAVVTFIAILIFVLFLLGFGNSEKAEVLLVQPQSYKEKIVAVGQLQLANETTLISEVSGEIQNIGAQEGDTISAGAIIISVNGSDQEDQLEQKKANYQDVDAQYRQLVEFDYLSAKEDLKRLNSKKEQAQKSYDAAARLYKEGALSQIGFMEYKVSYESALAEWNTAKLKVESLNEGGSLRNSSYAKLQNAQSVYESALKTKQKYQITVPWNSVLLKSYVGEQDYVRPGDALADIGEAGSYHVVTELDEKYYPYLTEGMRTTVSLGDLGKASEAEGRIDVITPKINNSTGTFQVKVGLPKEFPYQASDLTVNVEIIIKEKENAIVIPEQYLIQKEANVFVYDNGRAFKTPIKYESGPSSNLLVTHGLKKGDVIIKPSASIQDGKKIKINKGDVAS